jgi:hypothetical protein
VGVPVKNVMNGRIYGKGRTGEGCSSFHFWLVG